MNVANPVNPLKARARRFGFVVLLQPERPAGWLVTVRPAGDGLIEPIQVTAPTRDEAIAAAGRLFEEKLLDQLVATLSRAGVPVPNWEPGIVWDDHVEALFAAVRDNDLRL